MFPNRVSRTTFPSLQMSVKIVHRIIGEPDIVDVCYVCQFVCHVVCTTLSLSHSPHISDLQRTIIVKFQYNNMVCVSKTMSFQSCNHVNNTASQLLHVFVSSSSLSTSLVNPLLQGVQAFMCRKKLRGDLYMYTISLMLSHPILCSCIFLNYTYL